MPLLWYGFLYHYVHQLSDPPLNLLSSGFYGFFPPGIKHSCWYRTKLCHHSCTNICGLVLHTAALKDMTYCGDNHYYKCTCTCGWKDKQEIVWQIRESHAVMFISFLFLLLAYWPMVTDIRIYTCCWCNLPHEW